MKKPETWKLVLGHLLPARSDFSRDDWRTYVQRYLLPEIQTEVLRFYGENTSVEASHPGLDYANPGHRARLQAFPRHNQLFGMFDHLNLTESEIYALCKWEGTKLAKEHFERQHKTEIRDTTWDGVRPYNKQTPCGYVVPKCLLRGGESAQVKTAYELASSLEPEMEDELMQASEETDQDEDSGEESEDELQRSYGVELNQRLIDGRMDADWEQWMKEAIERGDVPGSLDPSHTQALQSFARLNSQHHAQSLISLGPNAALPHSSSSTGAIDVQQPGIDPTTQILNNDGTILQGSRPMSQWISHSQNSYRPASQPVGNNPSNIQQSTASQTNPLPTVIEPGIIMNSQFPPVSNSATRISPTYWGRDIPEIFSDSPRPHVAALQAQLPPPPQYTQFYPAARVVSAPAAGPAQMSPSATSSTSVPS